ncbi:MAG: SDR family oxidoreductase [Pseudomonas sp.]|uniref:SDR family NAD(P)-dependent oxidoreductase n=1 Tax=Pseudomonas sp. TaxID=306 RepID=UPI0039827FA1
MKRDFEGKVALVTGAGGGIGEAIAHDLAANGAKVLVVDVQGEMAEIVAGAICEQGGVAQAYQADVSLPASCEAMVKMAEEAFGALHYAVNNAGISGAFGPLQDASVEDWRRVMGINLDGVFYGMKYQLEAIGRVGGGAIVNIASIYAHLGLNRLDAYTASKHAVLGLTRSVAIEYAARGIRVNAVSPGPILTPLTRAHAGATDSIAAMTAIKRMGEPVEIAKAVSFLLSPDASFIVGSEIVVDGGVMLS